MKMAGFFDSLASKSNTKKIDLNPPVKEDLKVVEEVKAQEPEKDENRECLKEGNRKLVLALAGKFREVAKILEQMDF